MLCKNCGEHLSENTAYCPKCGNKCGDKTKTITLKCKSCNGMMEINESAQEVFCPYCGAKEKILDSDAVTIEKIRNNTYREIEFEKMRNAKENEELKEKRDEEKAYKKSILNKITLLGIFICAFVTMFSFINKNILCGMLSLIQICLFGVSWLMGMKVLTEKKRHMHVVLAIIGFLFAVPCMFSLTRGDVEKLKWPDSGLAIYIPNPNAKYGSITVNDEKSLCISIDKYSAESYESYVAACKEIGFIEDYDETSWSYDASNSLGYDLSLLFIDDSMDIWLNAPMTMGKFDWPKSEIAELIPKAKSCIGKIEWEADYGFVIYVGETSESDYKEYVDSVWEAGFVEEHQKGDTYFRAKNKDGYSVDVTYEGDDVMFIRMDQP